MDDEIKKLLKDTEETLNIALQEAKKRRNEDDAKYIMAAIGRNLSDILKPLLEKIAENAKINREELKSIIREIKVLAPQVNVSPPEVRVTVPEVKVPTVKIPPFLIPTPQVTVNAPEFPKEMEIKGLVGLFKTIGETLKKKFTFDFKDVNRDNPLPVILTDETGAFYKALMRMGSVGGGSVGPRIVGLKDKDDSLISPISEGHSGVGDGTATVAAAGTRVQISTVNIPCKKVWVQASVTNTGVVVVGAVTCVAAEATRRGKAFWPTQGDWFYVSDVSSLYIDSTVSGDKIHYFYER